MNVILFTEEEVQETRNVRLTGRRLLHIRDVHHAREGDELCVGMLDGKIGTGKVVHAGKHYIEFEVFLSQSPPEPCPATVVLALPRPKVLRRVLRSLAVLGIKRIVLLNACRVEKSYWQSPFLNAAAVREQLILGLEQSCDTVLPDVILKKRFKPFVEDELPEMIKGSLSLVAHPGAAESCPSGIKQQVTIAVGPEGGFIPYEIEMLEQAGFRAVSLGGRVMDVPTVIPYLIGRLFG